MIGLTLTEEAMTAYTGLKMNRKYRWIIYRIEGEKSVVIDALGEPTATFEDFVSKIPKSECRYKTLADVS